MTDMVVLPQPRPAILRYPGAGFEDVEVVALPLFPSRGDFQSWTDDALVLMQEHDRDLGEVGRLVRVPAAFLRFTVES